jgi:hypothetical protein
MRYGSIRWRARAGIVGAGIVPLTRFAPSCQGLPCQGIMIAAEMGGFRAF